MTDSITNTYPFYVYSRFVADAMAEVLGPPDSKGAYPAYVTDPNTDEGAPFATAINIDEWSTTATSSPPKGTPQVGYLSLYEEPTDDGLLGLVWATEDGAKASSEFGSVVGYGLVAIPQVLVKP